MYGQYPIFHHRNFNHKHPVFFVRAQNGGEQGGKKTKCRKGLLLFYIAFAGCFTFPIRSHPFPLDFTKAYLLICSYGIIGWGFAGLYGKAKERAVYPLTLLMTILGMVCRYVLEYGEASNVYNFTMLNILSYIILIPAFTVGAYHYIVKYLISAR